MAQYNLAVCIGGTRDRRGEGTSKGSKGGMGFRFVKVDAAIPNGGFSEIGDLNMVP